nr:NADH dehydrogenase subunit 5 [Nigrobaetis niger]
MYMKPAICNYVSLTLMLVSMMLLTTGAYLFMIDTTKILEMTLISLNSVDYTFIILLDSMSTTFMGVVLLIAGSVIFFSKDYMMGDPNISRFILLVTMFVLSMMALIMSPNLISILLGWDGLGLVSYCLVIYYQNIKSFNAGMLTALSNRIGDVMILVAIALMNSLGSYNFMNYFEHSWTLWIYTSILITIAACTKSAQIPFSAWLPAAMAAPTPVSALVHSSTLVTAGVYLMIRFSKPLISMNITKPLLVIACLTMFMAGLGASFEMDLKKIIALSTLSQLGLMMMALGMGMPKFAYFHMLSHALFKALLFMCAGNIIHGSGDNQDLRKMGIISLQMPLTSACLNTANLALCGTPFLAGFYSKDMILEAMLNNNMALIMMPLAYLATAFTVTYSIRLSYYALVAQPNSTSTHKLNDMNKFSCMAMMPLGLLSIMAGSALSWHLTPTPLLMNFPLTQKLWILFILLLGILMAWMIIDSNLQCGQPNMTSNWGEWAGSMWFLPTMATRAYSWATINLGFNSTYMVDRGWMEFSTISVLKSSINKSSKLVQAQQYINMKYYFISFLLWFIFVVLLQTL